MTSPVCPAAELLWKVVQLLAPCQHARPSSVWPVRAGLCVISLGRAAEHRSGSVQRAAGRAAQGPCRLCQCAAHSAVRLPGRARQAQPVSLGPAPAAERLGRLPGGEAPLPGKGLLSAGPLTRPACVVTADAVQHEQAWAAAVHAAARQISHSSCSQGAGIAAGSAASAAAVASAAPQLAQRCSDAGDGRLSCPARAAPA